MTKRQRRRQFSRGVLFDDIHIHQPTLVFTSGELEVYGSSMGARRRGSILIDLAGVWESKVSLFGLECDALKKYNPPVIKIEWEDGSHPSLWSNFWKDLIDFIVSGDHGYNKVTVSCVGGHGRTGTALSILAGLMGVSPKRPVEFVRLNYCKQAVETAMQIEYIEDILGIPINAKPSGAGHRHIGCIDGLW